MLQEERFSNIIDYLKSNKTAKVNDLARINKVSVDTVRRDLETLEGYGILERVRGGAVWKDANNTRNIYGMRVTVNIEKKIEISEMAGRVIVEGQTVMIGSGSTTVEIAKYIAAKYKRLTVITNDLDIVRIFSHKERFNIIIPGGLYDFQEHAVYGRQCEDEIGQYNADVCILAVNSISFERGISDFRLNQIDVFRKMMSVSECVAVAADSTKVGKTACMKICGIEEIDRLLCDSSLTPEEKQQFESAGIEVIMPE